MNSTQRQFSILFVGIIVLRASVSLAALGPTMRLAAWALGPLMFLILLAMGILYRRRGVEFAWLAKAALTGALLFVLCRAGTLVLSLQLAGPEGTRTAFPPVWTVLSIPGALIGVALPLVLGGILGGVSESEADRPKFLSMPPWLPTVTVGLAPLVHVLAFVQYRPGHLEYPSLAILFLTAPIGIFMALVGLALSAVRHRYGPFVTLGTVVYALGAALLFVAMKAIGFRFTFPP